jgi:glycosyltransferase involved in cell wall biosynthesis
MKISVIIPVYNVEQYLRECLDSVITQSYNDYEVICINDGSTDGSMAILQEYAKKYPRISLIDQANKGLSAARNAGIHAATGDCICLLDSDDYLEPDSLDILAKNTNDEDLICFNGRRFFEDGRTEEPDKGISAEFSKGWDYYKQYALVSRKFHFVCTVLRMYRRNFLLKNNLMFSEGIFHEDNLFTPIACYYAQKVKIIPDCLYVYRIRKGSITQEIKVKRLFDMIYIANSLSTFFITKHDIEKMVVYREIAGAYFRGFMNDDISVFGNNDKQLKKLINWKNYQSVSVYPRHKRIFRLINVHPVLFRCYVFFEKKVKKSIV